MKIPMRTVPSVIVATLCVLGAACGGASSPEITPGCAGDSCADSGVSASDATNNEAATGADSSVSADAKVTMDGGLGDVSIADAYDGPPGSDPCPTGPITYDCSLSCGATSPPGVDPCGGLYCYTWPAYVEDDHRIAPVTTPVVLRTPENPAARYQNTCRAACISNAQTQSLTPHVFAMAVRVQSNVSTNGLFRVRVAPPWWIEYPSQSAWGYPTFCSPTDLKGEGYTLAQTCLVGGGPDAIVIWTDDPNAPARNVYIDAVDNWNACGP